MVFVPAHRRSSHLVMFPHVWNNTTENRGINSIIVKGPDSNGDPLLRLRLADITTENITQVTRNNRYILIVSFQNQIDNMTVNITTDIGISRYILVVFILTSSSPSLQVIFEVVKTGI